MPFECVRFGVGQHVIEQSFDRRALRLGAKVFVITSGTETNPVRVSLQAEEGSTPHWVQWIAPSEWYVDLAPRYVVATQLVERTVEAVLPFLNRVAVEAAMGKFASMIRPEHQHKTSEFERNPLSVIFTVLERLDLVQETSASLTPAPAFVRTEPLQSYLLLTCFDRLGQPADWKDFHSWLSTNDCADVAASLVHVQGSAGQLAFTNELHSRYLKSYGTRHSFFRFVHEILPPDAQEKLFASVEITCLTVPPEVKYLPAATNEDKVRYLYQRRNDFTHKAAPAPRAGEWYVQSYTNNTQVVRGSSWSHIQTHGWPQVLNSCVRQGLASYLKEAALAGA